MARLARYAWAKYHALGNDYLVMDGTAHAQLPSTAFVRALCTRHHGVGSDGLLWRVAQTPATGAASPPAADAALRIYNPDGSEAEKSGNGLRIFARFLADFGYVQQAAFKVGVGQEVVHCQVTDAWVETTMGAPQFVGGAVGLAEDKLPTATFSLPVADQMLDCTLVGLGNPHCVVFDAPFSPAALRALGPKIERHPLFARRINVQFVRPVNGHTLEILIWERGAGETLASGSSSCAAVAAALLRRQVQLAAGGVRVCMPGGEVTVDVQASSAAAAAAATWPEGHTLVLRGAATAVARGELLGALRQLVD